MPSPADRRYSESHEWHKLEGDIVTLGISKFAVDELTDVTYVEVKPVGTTLKAGDTIGEVESVKATSEIYSAVGGEIVDVNANLADDPAILNRDPYEAGWLCRIKVSDAAPLESLMQQTEYDKKNPS
ncbi:MAG: glycine cleavage system protein GcvH [Phycisphaerales bacterium]|nr:glycine cleavage system protein GcvH [Phycisphaerales bacterium]